MTEFLVHVLVIREEWCDEEKLAETICRIRAVVSAVTCAVVLAERFADARAELRVVIRADRRVEDCAVVGAVVRSEFRAEKMATMQKWVEETVQDLAPISYVEKKWQRCRCICRRNAESRIGIVRI